MPLVEGNLFVDPRVVVEPERNGVWIKIHDSQVSELVLKLWYYWDELESLLKLRESAQQKPETIAGMLQLLTVIRSDVIDLTTPPFVPEDHPPMILDLPDVTEIPPPPGWHDMIE